MPHSGTLLREAASMGTEHDRAQNMIGGNTQSFSRPRLNSGVLSLSEACHVAKFHVYGTGKSWRL